MEQLQRTYYGVSSLLVVGLFRQYRLSRVYTIVLIFFLLNVTVVVTYYSIHEITKLGLHTFQSMHENIIITVVAYNGNQCSEQGYPQDVKSQHRDKTQTFHFPKL